MRMYDLIEKKKRGHALVAAKDVAHAAPVCLMAGSAVTLFQDTEGGAGCVWVVFVV